MHPHARTPETAAGARRLDLAPAQAALSELARSSTAALEPDALAAAVLAPLIQATTASRASLIRLDAPSGRLRIAAAVGIDPSLVGRQLEPRPRSISEWVAREKLGVIVNGEVRDQPFEGVERGSLIESAMCLPLVSRGRVVGVLNLARSTPAPVFSGADLDAVLRAVEPVARALERLLGVERAERSATALERALARVERSALPAGETETGTHVFARAHVPGLGRGADVCERVADGHGGSCVLVAGVEADRSLAAPAVSFLQGAFLALASPERSASGLVARLQAEFQPRHAGLDPPSLWVAQLSRGGELSSCRTGGGAAMWIPSDDAPIRSLGAGTPRPSAEGRALDEESIRLLPGDAVVTVSESLLRAPGPDGRPLGLERLIEALDPLRHKSLDRIVRALCEEAVMKSGRPAPTDDVTAFALRFTPGN